ncbi:MAG TPA: tetratricopeptide repeat protein [Polyangiaceae bacterium]|nr:tetratricopeptide repeat protein [Polyangiaceae bacterium]
MAIDREKVLEAAQKLVEKKRYDKAILEYQKLVDSDPNDVRTLLKIGDLQLKMEAFPEAIATYERVGKYYAQQGFALKAIAVYKQIREIVQKHVPHLEERYAHIAPRLADLYQQLGLVSDALAALDEVAVRLSRQQRDAEALDVFRKIVTLDPTNPIPHLRLAEALSRSRDTDGAVSEFGVAAALLIKVGQTDNALKVLERLLHHKPEAAQARLAAELYLQRGAANDGMQALAKLQICVQANPKDLTTLDLLARAFGKLGQPRKGIEVQKEMARIAREQQRYDVFGELVDKLLELAPQDEGVQELAASRDEVLAHASEVEEVPQEEEAPPADEEFIEEVDSAVIEEILPEPAPSAEPLLLRQSGEATAIDSAQYDEIDGAPEISTAGEELVPELPIEQDPRVLALISESQSYRRVRLYDRAVRALIRALEIDGRSVPARAELRDVYLEAGEQEDAIVEMLNIASLQLDALDGDGAAATLQDVLALDPTNERAAAMLRELGYEPVEDAPQPAPSITHAEYQPPPSRQRMPSYDPEAPLPSYDLDEPATGQQAAPEDDALPSFPLDDSALIAPPTAVESAASFDLVGSKTTAVSAMPPEPGTSAYNKPSNEEIEEALEEADFFASRGLFEDAKTVLSEQLARAPNHKLLIERLREIDEQETAAQRGSGTRARPQSAAPSLAPDEFDIASSLEALDSLEVAPEAQQMMNETGQVDVEEVFAQFKEKVSQTLAADDGTAHRDPGQAYKEMGLADDAINEFEIAARDPKLEVEVRYQIGMIEIERGNLKQAIAAFQKALNAKVRTPEQETILCFEIGAAYEATRATKDALSYYNRVARRDANYRDVQDRIRKLSRHDTKAPVRQVAVGADDEFDRAFDELLGDGKLGK